MSVITKISEHEKGKPEQGAHARTSFHHADHVAEAQKQKQQDCQQDQSQGPNPERQSCETAPDRTRCANFERKLLDAAEHLRSGILFQRAGAEIPSRPLIRAFGPSST